MIVPSGWEVQCNSFLGIRLDCVSILDPFVLDQSSVQMCVCTKNESCFVPRFGMI